MWWLPEFVEQGGVVMGLLLACSVFALAVTLERAFALRRSVVLPKRLLDALDGLDSKAAVKALADDGALLKSSALGRVVHVILENRRAPREQNENAMAVAGREAASSLERGLAWIEIVAVTAPLLGLLGTVLGMVEVFGSFPGNTGVLPQGIRKALYTTVAGLSLGIPMLAISIGCSRRVERLAMAMEHVATRLLNRIYEEPGRDGEADRD